MKYLLALFCLLFASVDAMPQGASIRADNGQGTNITLRGRSILGGTNNINAGNKSVVAGETNVIAVSATNSAAMAGKFIRVFADNAFAGAGFSAGIAGPTDFFHGLTMSSNAHNSFAGSGEDSGVGGEQSFLGTGNDSFVNARLSGIVSGSGNIIYGTNGASGQAGNNSFIGGGTGNHIGQGNASVDGVVDTAFIGAPFNASILGGGQNLVDTNSGFGAIMGGRNNRVVAHGGQSVGSFTTNTEAFSVELGFGLNTMSIKSNGVANLFSENSGSFILAAYTNPAAPLVALGAGGNPDGVYRYAVSWVSGSVEYPMGLISDTINPLGEQVELTAIPVGASGTTARKVYRSLDGGPFLLLTTIANNVGTTFTDNVADPLSGAPVLNSYYGNGHGITNLTGAFWQTNSAEGTITNASKAVMVNGYLTSSPLIAAFNIRAREALNTNLFDAFGSDGSKVFSVSQIGEVTAASTVISLGHGLFTNSVYQNIVTFTSGGTLGSTNDVVVMNVNLGTVTLPTAVGIRGKSFTIKNGHASNLTVARTGGQTIDGVAADGTLTTLQCRRYTSDGANWWITAGF